MGRAGQAFAECVEQGVGALLAPLGTVEAVEERPVLGDRDRRLVVLLVELDGREADARALVVGVHRVELRDPTTGDVIDCDYEVALLPTPIG